MPDNIIDSFLYALGWKLDEASISKADASVAKSRVSAEDLKKTLVALGGQVKTLGDQFASFSGGPTDRVHKSTQMLSADLKQLGLFAVGTTTAFAAGFVEIARSYEKLFYTQQRTGMTTQDLARLQYTGPQIGLGANTLVAQVEAFSARLRDLPTLKQYFAGLTGGATDPGEIVDRLAQSMLRLRKAHDALGEAILRRQISMGGMDPEAILRIALNKPAYDKAKADFDKRIAASGLDYKKTMQDATEVTRQLETVWLQLGIIAGQGFEEAYPTIKKFEDEAVKLLDWAAKFNASHPGAALAENLAAATAAGTLLLGVLGKIGFAGAGAASTTMTAIGGVTAAVAGAAATTYGEFKPTPADSWVEDLLAHFGIKGPGNQLSPEAKRNWDGAPHFAEGGIVPVNAHAGEIILPRGLSDGLLGLVARGGLTPGPGGDQHSGLSGIIGQLIGDFRAWWGGSPGYAPYVRLLLDAATQSFFTGDGTGGGSGAGTGIPGGGGTSGGTGGPSGGGGTPQGGAHPQRTAPSGGAPSGRNAETGSPWSAPSASGSNPSRDDPRGVEQALRQSASRYGLNPDDVVKVARAEGIRERKYATWDVNNWSYGAMQMHVGGLATEFQNATHLDPADPKNETAMNDWALKYASQHGWGKWSSVRFGHAPVPRHVAPVDVQGAPNRSPFPAGLVDFNSRGEPYAASLNHMTAQEKANVEQSMKAIRDPKSGWGKIPDWYAEQFSDLAAAPKALARLSTPTYLGAGPATHNYHYAGDRQLAQTNTVSITGGDTLNPHHVIGVLNDHAGRWFRNAMPVIV